MSLKADQHFDTVTAVSKQLIPPKPGRRALIISAPHVNVVTFSWREAAVLYRGITLYPGMAPLVLSYDVIGDALSEEIHAVTAAGAEVIGWLEVFD